MNKKISNLIRLLIFLLKRKLFVCSFLRAFGLFRRDGFFNECGDFFDGGLNKKSWLRFYDYGRRRDDGCAVEAGEIIFDCQIIVEDEGEDANDHRENITH